MGWFERPEFGANVGLIDEIYRQYLDNPESVSPAWRDFFAENEPEDGETEPATIHEAPAPVKEPAPEPAKAEQPPASKAPDAPTAKEQPRPKPAPATDGTRGRS